MARLIVEEWKSSPKVWPNHRVQMGAYFLLIDDQLGVKPSYGFIVCGDGTRHQIEKDETLPAWVLELAGQIRAARAAVTVPIPGNPKPDQCCSCGHRRHSGMQGIELSSSSSPGGDS